MSFQIDSDGESQWFDFDALLDETLCRAIVFRRECRSTNDIALSLESDDDSLPVLVITDSQTGGRGRGSNRWWARHGALTFSLRMKPTVLGLQMEHWPLASLTSAIAVADVLNTVLPSERVGLKWPNDVFIDGRKACGILVEPLPQQQTDLVFGIGLNVQNSLQSAPDDIRATATSLVDATGTQHSPCDLLIALLQRLETLLRQLARQRLALRDRWQQQCILSGRPIELTSGSQTLSGMCHGIDDRGAIRIEPAGAPIRSVFGGTVRIAGTVQQHDR